jgi:2-oxoglutarate ferredoxin oxidoreductase subunit gamma
LGRQELRIAGFGGQGVVLAGQIIGQAVAIYDKKYASFTQNYGPESRGGSCTAEVVTSENPIGYPYVVAPNIVVILSQDAYKKYGSDVPKDSLVVIESDLVKPAVDDKRPMLSIPATQIARDMGRVVVANVVLLGFLAAVSDLVSTEGLRKSLLATVPKGTGDFNLKAFEAGYKYGQEHNSRRN